MSPLHLCTCRPQCVSLLALAFGLATLACGGASDSTRDRNDPVAGGQMPPASPETGGETPPVAGALEPGSEGTSDGSEELPINPGGDSAAGGTSLNIDELLATPNCSAGWLPEDPESEPECASTFGSICFENDEAACTCAGCGMSECIVAESYPTQISCRVETLGCNFKWFDACFETADEACSAAGCAIDSCVILESYPAQVSCE